MAFSSASELPVSGNRVVWSSTPGAQHLADLTLRDDVAGRQQHADAEAPRPLRAMSCHCLPPSPDRGALASPDPRFAHDTSDPCVQKRKLSIAYCTAFMSGRSLTTEDSAAAA